MKKRKEEPPRYFSSVCHDYPISKQVSHKTIADNVIIVKCYRSTNPIMEDKIKTSDTNRYKFLLDRLLSLRTKITEQADEKLSPFARYYSDGVLSPSAINLAHYLLLRQYDLRDMQRELFSLGLSSLGRGEANILENIDKVIHLLEQITKSKSCDKAWSYNEFLRSLSDHNESLSYHTDKLLGEASKGREVRIMVTLPSEAADNYQLVLSLIKAGMNCARINCAHDNRHAWLKMLHHIHLAENETGLNCRLLMDIGGQKIRTGAIEDGHAVHHIKVKHNEYGTVIEPGIILLLAQSQFDSESETYHSDYFKIAIENEHYTSLQTGDHLGFTDIRGKKRSLEIFKNEETGLLRGVCQQSAYISPQTTFKRFRNTRSKKQYHQQHISIKSFQRLPAKIKIHCGDQLLLTPSNTLGSPAQRNEQGEIIRCARIGVSHDEVINNITQGNPIWIDDGKIGATVKSVSAEGLLLKIIHAPPKGATIHSNKGLNFPETELDISPITDKDLEDLDFIAEYADIVGYSFVQSREDMSYLLYELKKRNASHLPVIAKIETKKAVKNLPDIILSTIGRTQLGIMIARGDLAIELGSIRMAEIQEEILWICEAAHVPVVWATQVLETLAKNGIQSRPEITDAAMGERSECVMLNKGPYILDALNTLDNILKRMQEHQHKKTARLRALKQWTSPTFYALPDTELLMPDETRVVI